MEDSVMNGDVRLAFEEAGEGAPVLCLHGLTATRRYVLMGSRRLERSGRRVILADARGHGRSTAGTFGYAELMADVVALVEHLELERPVLAGSSMGAHTAVRFALEYPGRAAGLVLITPSFDPRHHPANVADWDALALGLSARGIDGFVDAYDLEALPPRWRKTMETVLRQRLAHHQHLDAVADALRAIPRSAPFDAIEQLGSLDLPVLVIGSQDEVDPAHPLSVAQAYAAAIPGARLRVEEPGSSPLAWQGGQLSRAIQDLA